MSLEHFFCLIAHGAQWFVAIILCLEVQAQRCQQTLQGNKREKELKEEKEAKEESNLGPHTEDEAQDEEDDSLAAGAAAAQGFGEEGHDCGDRIQEAGGQEEPAAQGFGEEGHNWGDCVPEAGGQEEPAAQGFGEEGHDFADLFAEAAGQEEPAAQGFGEEWQEFGVEGQERGVWGHSPEAPMPAPLLHKWASFSMLVGLGRIIFLLRRGVALAPNGGVMLLDSRLRRRLSKPRSGRRIQGVSRRSSKPLGACNLMQICRRGGE